jgi:ParB family transcriptional regulator, chromosome partitioning protein
LEWNFVTKLTPEDKAAKDEFAALKSAHRENERACNGAMLNVENETVEPTGINIPDRLRPLNEERVVEIMESMRKVGQISPILVRCIGDGERLDLVAGRHRLEAAIRLGWPQINVRGFSCDDIEARKLEIAENLHRAELTALERSEHVAEWIRLTEAEHVSGQVEPKLGRPEGGVRGAAREINVDRNEARRAVKIADITPEAKSAAVAAGLGDNQSALLKVATAPQADQVDVVAAIVAEKAKPKPVAIEPARKSATAEKADRYFADQDERLKTQAKTVAIETQEPTTEQYRVAYINRADHASKFAVRLNKETAPDAEAVQWAQLVIDKWTELRDAMTLEPVTASQIDQPAAVEPVDAFKALRRLWGNCTQDERAKFMEWAGLSEPAGAADRLWSMWSGTPSLDRKRFMAMASLVEHSSVGGEHTELMWITILDRSYEDGTYQVVNQAQEPATKTVS